MKRTAYSRGAIRARRHSGETGLGRPTTYKNFESKSIYFQEVDSIYKFLKMEKYHRISKGSGVMAIIKNKTKHVTAQSIVNGAPMSAARIPSKTGKPFFFPVEMYA
ncbi:hypothetical protein, partial [Methanosarcina mazei]